MKKVHFRHIRLRNNAGMDFPACKAGEKLLDLDAGRWPTTGIPYKVTCKHCLGILRDTMDENETRGNVGWATVSKGEN